MMNSYRDYPWKKKENYLDVSARVKLLDTGVDLDRKEIISLDRIVQTMSKGHARFTSNVMAIVGEGKRIADVKVPGGTVRTTIPRHIDRILKTHNTISQEALNQLTFVWVDSSVIGNPAPLYLTGGSGVIQFIQGSGQTINFAYNVFVITNTGGSLTFLFLVTDDSGSSYTATQEQLTPFVIQGPNITYYQLSSPLSIADLVVSKSSNQVLTFIWAIQLNLSSNVGGQGLENLFAPGAQIGNNLSMTVYSGGSGVFGTVPAYYFLNINGILYAVAIAMDTSSNGYTPSAVGTRFWTANGGSSNLSISTPPNPPGAKPTYGAMSWYNGFYLSL